MRSEDEERNNGMMLIRKDKAWFQCTRVKLSPIREA